MAKNWYIVHTYSGFENKVRESLNERIESHGLGEYFGEVLVPMEKVVEMVCRREGQVTFFNSVFTSRRNCADLSHQEEPPAWAAATAFWLLRASGVAFWAGGRLFFSTALSLAVWEPAPARFAREDRLPFLPPIIRPYENWQAWRESNPQPSDLESDALA